MDGLSDFSDSDYSDISVESSIEESDTLEEECAEKTTSWTPVSQCPITIKVYPHEVRPVASFVQEIGVTLQSARDKILLRGSLLTDKQLLEYLFSESSDFARSISERIHVGLRLLRAQQLEEKEILRFFHALLLLHLYGESVEGLYKNSSLYAKVPMITFDRFVKLLEALGASEHGNEAHRSSWDPDQMNPTFIEAIRRFSHIFSNIGVHREYSVITIDDDKIRLRSKRVTALNLQRTFQRGGNPGPTQYAAVSVHTGLVLALYYQQIKESTNDCVRQLAACNVQISIC